MSADIPHPDAATADADGPPAEPPRWFRAIVQSIAAPLACPRELDRLPDVMRRLGLSANRIWDLQREYPFFRAKTRGVWNPEQVRLMARVIDGTETPESAACKWERFRAAEQRRGAGTEAPTPDAPRRIARRKHA